MLHDVSMEQPCCSNSSYLISPKTLVQTLEIHTNLILSLKRSYTLHDTSVGSGGGGHGGSPPAPLTPEAGGLCPP